MIKLPEWIKNNEEDSQVQTTDSAQRGIVDSFQSYFQSIRTRIVNWKNYPTDFITIHECQGTFKLYHFKNTLLSHTEEVVLSDYDWREYITKHENLPIYFVVQGQDCEFRNLPTNQIQFWDRFFLFNQIRANEFSENDLVNHYRATSPSEKTDIFVSIRSNDSIKQFVKVLNSLRNPIAGVLSWDIELTMRMQKYASANRAIRHWVVSLIPIDSSTYTMLVMHQNKILLQRIISSKKSDDLEKEIRSTLQFLQRQGYTNGQAVSVMIPESEETKEFSNAELESIHIPKRFIEKEAFRPANPFLNLLPETLRQASLAYELPRLGIKFLIPFSVVLLLLWASVQIKSFFQDYESNSLNISYHEHKKKIAKNADEQLHRSKLFIKYLQNNNNLSSTISALNKLLKGKTQVSSITWKSTEDHKEIFLKFPTTLKKNQDIKKYINQNCERLLENVTLTWEDQGLETTLIIQQQAGKHDN